MIKIMGFRRLGYKIGLIRVRTVSDEELRKRVFGRMIEEFFPNVKVVSYCIEGQPEGIYDEETMRKGIPKILDAIKKLEQEVDAIIMGCCSDPGLEEGRKLVRTPLIGAGAAVAAVALQYGSRVGLLAENDLPPLVPPSIKRILGDNLIARESPRNVRDAYDLFNPKNRNEIFEAAERLKKRNVDVIALGCTGYSVLRIAPVLAERLQIPVIDPMIAAASMAVAMIYSKSIQPPNSRHE